MEGCHAKRASTKGTKLYNVVGSHASLIAIHLPSWGFQQTNIEQTVCMRQKPQIIHDLVHSVALWGLTMRQNSLGI